MENLSEDERNVQYYVYLEALKRLKEEEHEIMKSLAFKAGKYQESLVCYLELYSKYVNIIKLFDTHHILHENQQQAIDQSEKDANLDRMIQQLKNNMNSEKLDPEQLDEMKKLLSQFSDYPNTRKLCHITQHKDARVKGIDQSLARIEAETKKAIDILVTRITDTFQKMWQPLDSQY